MLIGNYEVREELGRGAAGAVYRAYDPRLGRDVAIKLLRPAKNAVARGRFEREASALARVRHPHVLPVHAVGEIEGRRPYLVLALATGGTVGDVLDRTGPFDFAEATRIGAKLARALEHLHDAGVVHRDLKPDNVLLHDGEPVLADFGLAKDLYAPDDHLSQTGALMGTPGFWSPEQAAGRKRDVGPATDVYSLGATLYALLTGELPCAGDNLIQIAQATACQKPPRPSSLRAGFPARLESVVMNCLEKDPAARPSAASLADALEALLGRRDRGSPPPRTCPGPGRAGFRAGPRGLCVLCGHGSERPSVRLQRGRAFPHSPLD